MHFAFAGPEVAPSPTASTPVSLGEHPPSVKGWGCFVSNRDPDIIVEDPTLAAGFTQIPNALLRRADISQGAKVVYMMLLSYAWQEGSCFPGQERLAQTWVRASAP